MEEGERGKSNEKEEIRQREKERGDGFTFRTETDIIPRRQSIKALFCELGERRNRNGVNEAVGIFV